MRALLYPGIAALAAAVFVGGIGAVRYSTAPPAFPNTQDGQLAKRTYKSD
jgi:hypothetical protein